MPETQKITVLLADEDTLRRDGLASVLRENVEIEVLSGCSDGQTAIDEIRDLRPDVAIVDLNLPVLHGIELVRRIRGEGLGTKIIILSGTMDDEIVREVVRAGADAYLLKNGPARHLTDAINYVRDGGQYFSPQLHRDGRDRHLLEEPPRIPPDRDFDDVGQSAAWHGEDGRPRQDRRARPRMADPMRFRERLREETSRKLRDRDYDIMAEMADGIRPILDRLDEIEDRVMEMESGDEPLPADPRGWLSAQLSDTLTGSRSAQERGGGRLNYRDVEARLPELIERAVTKRFQSMAGKLQEEIEEQHVRTLETFVKNIQVKLVQRVSVLEQNMQHQADAMLQLREYNQRTEDNLSRLITGVDKLAHELPKRLSAAQQEAESSAEQPVKSGVKETSGREAGPKDRRGVKSSGFSKKKLVPIVFWILVLAGITGAVVYGIRSKDDDSSPTTAPPIGKEIQTAKSKATAAAVKAAAAPPIVAGTDTRTRLDAAKQAMDRKEYTTAEDIYKQVVQEEPHNVDALTGLASVLYREDKIEESAAVLDRIPKN